MRPITNAIHAERTAGNSWLAAAVVVGHFAPLWLVGILSAGWIYNAALYYRRATAVPK